MRVYDQIKAIAKEKKIPVYKIESAVGLSYGSICKWNEVSPTIGNLKKVADYLNVKIDQLVGG